MRLRSLDTRHSPVTLDLGQQRLAEQRQRAEALDASEARLEVEERRGQPPLLLVGGAPAIDFGHPLFDEAVQRLQAVRGFQADPQLAVSRVIQFSPVMVIENSPAVARLVVR